jgi:homoserine kinase
LDNGKLTSATTLRVPASSANLGPGFDSLGIALRLYLTCRFSPAARLAIRCEGRDASLISSAEDNLIWRTAADIATREGGALPAVDLAISNESPLGKGLGSSAAAITAGVIIASCLLDLGSELVDIQISAVEKRSCIGGTIHTRRLNRGIFESGVAHKREKFALIERPCNAPAP